MLDCTKNLCNTARVSAWAFSLQKQPQDALSQGLKPVRTGANKKQVIPFPATLRDVRKKILHEMARIPLDRFKVSFELNSIQYSNSQAKVTFWQQTTENLVCCSDVTSDVEPLDKLTHVDLDIKASYKIVSKANRLVLILVDPPTKIEFCPSFQ